MLGIQHIILKQSIICVINGNTDIIAGVCPFGIELLFINHIRINNTRNVLFQYLISCNLKLSVNCNINIISGLGSNF